MPVVLLPPKYKTSPVPAKTAIASVPAFPIKRLLSASGLNVTVAPLNVALPPIVIAPVVPNVPSTSKL